MLLRLCLCIASFSLYGCAIFQEPDILEESGVVLGDTKQKVHDGMGKPFGQLNFTARGHDFSIWSYGSTQIDYQPIVDEKEAGPLHEGGGIREFPRKEYRLVFVDGRLCSIVDYLRNTSYLVSTNELPPPVYEILEEIHKQE